MYIVHLADVHIGSSPNRVAEYEAIFAALRDKIQALNLKKDFMFVIAGDIFHHKVKYCGDDVRLFELLIASTFGAKVLIIPGNHDGNIDNHATSVDLITPLVDKYKNVTYLRDSCVYEYNGITFAHLSVYDKAKSALTWLGEQEIKGGLEHLRSHGVFLYHGFVNGAKFGLHTVYESRVPQELMSKFKICMLGDIHETQFVYPNTAYSGSLIQQNLGDTLEKGFIIWDTDTAVGTFHRLVNTWGFLRFDLRGKSQEEAMREINAVIKSCPTKLRKVSIITDSDNKTVQDQVKAIKEKYGRIDAINQSRREINLSGTVKETLAKILDSKGATTMQRDNIIQRHMNNTVQQSCAKWTILRMTWSNLYKYRGENTIDFAAYTNVISGVIAKNRSGKSSILDILTFTLYDTLLRGTRKFIIHSSAKEGWCEVVIKIDNRQYTVRRDESRKPSECKVTLKSIDLASHAREVLTQESIPKTYEYLTTLIGSDTQFLATGMYINKDYDLISMKRLERMKLLPEIMGLTSIRELTKTLTSRLKTLKLEFSRIPKPTNPNAKLLHRTAMDTVAQAKEQLSTINNEIAALTEQYAASQDRTTAANKMQELRTQLTDLEQRYDPTNLQPHAVPMPHSDLTTVTNLASTPIDTKALERIERLEQLITQIPHDYVPRNYAAECDAIETEIVSLTNLISKLKQRGLIDVEALTSEIDNYPQYIKGLTFSPACSNCINNAARIDNESDSIDENNAALNSLKLKLIEAREIERNHIECERKENQITSLRNRLEQVRALKSIQERYDEVTALKNAVVDLKSIENAKEEVRRWHSYNGYLKTLTMTPIKLKIDRLKDELNNMQAVADRCSAVNDNEVVGRMRELNERKSALEATAIIEANNAKIYARDVDIINASDGKLDELVNEIEEMELYIDALGTDGLMNKVVEVHMDLIIDKVNTILSSISDFAIGHTLDGSHLDLFIIENGNRFPIDMGSGFQCFIISLIIRFVLADTLFTAPEFIFIDEGFGCIDEDNMQRVIDSLNAMKNLFNFIFIISHNDSLKTEIECPLYITTHDTYSTIGEDTVDTHNQSTTTTTSQEPRTIKQTYSCPCSIKPLYISGTKKHEGSMKHRKWLQQQPQPTVI